MNEPGMTPEFILLRLVLAGVIGALIGYERRMHHKAIGISGMMLVAIGSATFMLLAKRESARDAAAISRVLQGLLQGIGFLAGAVIFKGGTDVRGIKTAAAIWITGALGLSVGTGFWWLGLIGGIGVAGILFVADLFPSSREIHEEAQKATGTKGEQTGDSGMFSGAKRPAGGEQS